MRSGEPLLSVAELQVAVRRLRGQKAACTVVPQPSSTSGGHHGLREWWDSTEPRPMGSAVLTAETGSASVAPVAALGSTWLAVVTAHAGAGASTLALALADTLAARRRPTALIDTAPPLTSGLVAVSTAEFGADTTSSWRRGVRALAGSTDITVDRRASEVAPHGWPVVAAGSVVVDLGHLDTGTLALLATASCRVVVVCRSTVPGVRRAEQVLAALPRAVAVAAVGGDRWPGAVQASVGPRLRVLRTERRVVAVPVDRELEITGPLSSRLPKPVLAAARALTDLVEGIDPGAARLPGTFSGTNERKVS